MALALRCVLALRKAAGIPPPQSIVTGIGDVNSRTVQHLGTWTDRLKRWNSQGQDTSAEPPQGKQSEESTESNSPLGKLEDALKAKGKQVKELEDKYLRALAETENVRQRMVKQVEEAKKFGINGFAKDLLDVADTLEKASESISEKDLESGGKSFIALAQGLKLTEAELQKVFKKNGLTKIDGKGEKFDPSLHEALFEVVGDEAGTVAVVSRHGYMLHDRTLRPARVGVVKSK